jgi:hypothetical protein
MSQAPFQFLTARWENLILANYSVPAELLTPYLPQGVELDSWDGKHWCSLVAFQFLRTRVLGVAWPGFRDFPEWNLRFYVRRGPDRGVVFIRELVPQWFVASVARLIYNEPYRSTRLGCEITSTDEHQKARYSVDWGGRSHTLAVTAERAAYTPTADSREAWFKEQIYGYGVTHRGRTLRYRVQHPTWQVYPVTQCEVDVDWERLYGPAWRDFSARQPESIVYAVGSAVSVYPFGTRLGVNIPVEPTR